MYLFTPRIILSLLALRQVASVYSYPTSRDVSGIAAVLDSSSEEKRASPVVVPLFRRPTHDTWLGYQVLRTIFGEGRKLSDAEIIASTKATYATVESKSNARTFLVSTVYIPEVGLASGTIWTGSSDGFATYAQSRAEIFWASVGGEEQGLVSWTSTSNAWHAEAVAVAKAEDEFESAMVEGRWPAGTKIYTYGRINNEKQEKASCRDDSSPVKIPCKTWLDRLEISIIEPTT